MELALRFWLTLCGAYVVYWLLPRGRTWFLAFASTAYLVSIAPRVALVTAVWSLLVYWLAPRAQRSLAWWSLLTGSALCYLLYFKYIPPVITALGERFGISQLTLQIALPLGISYFTFKLLHYVIEVGRGNIKPHSPQLFLLYCVMFTIFPAGPIQRFDYFLENREKTWSSQSMAEGITRIIYGLIKKFFLAEVLLLPLVTWPLNTERFLVFSERTSAAELWAHLAVWYVYAYLDFSAYSDIAIGTSRLFGFRIMENFNFPWLAKDIVDFWQRWHMSLAHWCRSYVYMPLIGLTRNPYLATFATMAIIGVWHRGNLNWLCWGLYHATGLAIFQTWRRFTRSKGWTFFERSMTARIGMRVITFAFVTGGYVFVISERFGIYAAIRLLAKLFGANLPG